MKKEEIKQKVTDIVIDVLGVEASEVQEGSDLQNDLGADSLDVVELTMNVEKEFNIELGDAAEVEKIHTVGDLIEKVATCMEAGGGK
ncbi:MAG: acyl carrier protein [Prevotella sp.]|nr:acyl carrier protein [Prevotella sp.]